MASLTPYPYPRPQPRPASDLAREWAQQRLIEVFTVLLIRSRSPESVKPGGLRWPESRAEWDEVVESSGDLTEARVLALQAQCRHDAVLGVWLWAIARRQATLLDELWAATDGHELTVNFSLLPQLAGVPPEADDVRRAQQGLPWRLRRLYTGAADEAVSDVMEAMVGSRFPAAVPELPPPPDLPLPLTDEERRVWQSTTARAWPKLWRITHEVLIPALQTGDRQLQERARRDRRTALETESRQRVIRLSAPADLFPVPAPDPAEALERAEAIRRVDTVAGAEYGDAGRQFAHRLRAGDSPSAAARHAGLSQKKARRLLSLLQKSAST